MNNSARSLVFLLALAVIALAAAPARAESALSARDFSFLSQSGKEQAQGEKPPSLFGGFEAGDRTYAGFGLSWIVPAGHLRNYPYEKNYGTGLGFVIYGGSELRKGLAVEFTAGLDGYRDTPGGITTLWSTIGVRLQPIEWTFSPYAFGGIGLACLAMSAPTVPAPVGWDGSDDAEGAFTTNAGAGIEILLLDDLAFAVEFRYRYQHGISANINTHQYGIGGNFVFQ